MKCVGFLFGWFFGFCCCSCEARVPVDQSTPASLGSNVEDHRPEDGMRCQLSFSDFLLEQRSVNASDCKITITEAFISPIKNPACVAEEDVKNFVNWLNRQPEVDVVQAWIYGRDISSIDSNPPMFEDPLWDVVIEYTDSQDNIYSISYNDNQYERLFFPQLRPSQACPTNLQEGSIERDAIFIELDARVTSAIEARCGARLARSRFSAN